MLQRIEGNSRPGHFGEELHEAAEAKANRIVDQELRRALWTEAELRSRKKGDEEKIAIARRLRAETTMTMEWIAARLHMGTRTHLNHLLYWHRRRESENRTARATPRGRKTAPVTRGSLRAPTIPLPPAPDFSSILLTDETGFDARFD
jgi:hypothetical protein